MLINGKEIKLNLTGNVVLVYKETFKKDFFTASANFLRDGALTDALEMVYAFCKAQDPAFMPYKEYMNSIHLGDIIGVDGQSELLEAINDGLSTSAELKKKETETDN